MQNSIKIVRPYHWIYPLVSAILFSCTPGSEESLNKTPKIEYKSFVDELDGLRINGCKSGDIVALKNKHGRFFDLWWYEVMGLGVLNMSPDSVKTAQFQYWLNQNARVFLWVKNHYQKDREYQDLLSNGLTRLHGELNAFNDTQAAEFVVYDYLSQFSNYSTFTDEQVVKENGKNRKKFILAYSKEMFLNDTFPVYGQLDLPSFFTKYCATNQIAYQLVLGYLKMRYEPNYVRKSMLDEAVFQGKLWHSALEAFPDKKPWEILGYTEKEWEWLQAQEGQIWKHFIDNKLLFNTRFQDYKRYFAYGLKTFGGGVPEDCPPLIGNYIGLKIVEAWVKEQGDYNLYDLWKIQDANTVLQQSTYNPIK